MISRPISRPARGRAAKTKHRAQGKLLLLSVAPFPATIFATLLLAWLASDAVPRDIAPGSSLGLPGIVAAILSWGVVVGLVRRHWPEEIARRAASFIAAISALASWPVWTMGLLPSVNGLSLEAPVTSPMRVERIEITRASRTGKLHHWAWLKPQGPLTPLAAGRYLLDEQEYARLDRRNSDMAQVVHARGLLGAQTVLSVE